MRRLRHILFRTLLACIGLGLVVVLTLTAIVYTQTGSQWAVQQAQHFFPKSLSIGKFQGVLASQFDIHDIRWSGNPQLHIGHFSLRWDLNQLFNAKLKVHELNIHSVQIGLPEPTEPKEPSSTFKIPNAFKLPIEVVLNNIFVYDVNIQQGSQHKNIKHVILVGKADKDSTQIAKLEINAMGALANYSGSTTHQFPFDTNGELNWNYAHEELARAQGDVALSGDIRNLHIKYAIDAPYSTHGRVALQTGITAAQGMLNSIHLDPKNIRIAGTLDIEALQTQKIAAKLTPVTVFAHANINGSLSDIKAQLSSKLDINNYPTLRVEALTHLQEKSLSLKNLKLSTDVSQATASLEGTVKLSQPAPEIDLSMNWENIQWPLKGNQPIALSRSGKVHLTGQPTKLQATFNAALNEKGLIKGHIKTKDQHIQAQLNWKEIAHPLQDPSIHSEQGTVFFSGTPATFSTEIQAALTSNELPTGQIHLKGQSDDKIFSLNQLTIDALGITLLATGSVDYRKEIEAKLTAELRDFNPGQFLETYPGNIDTTLSTQISTTKTGFNVFINSLSSVGELRGHPLALNVQGKAIIPSGNSKGLIQRFTNKEAGLTLQSLNLSQGAANIKLSGKVSDTLHAQWLVDIPDLSHLVPDAQGQFFSKGSAQGSLLQPAFDVTTSGKDLQWQQWEVKGMSASGTITIDPEKPSSLLTTIKGFRMNTFRANEARLSVQGLQNEHQLAFALDSDMLKSNLKIHGSLAEDHWQFSLVDGELKLPSMPAWSLTKPGTGIISTTDQTFSEHCWQSVEARFCWQGQHKNAKLKGQLSIKDLPVNHFAYWLPPSLLINSNINADLTLEHSFKDTLPTLHTVATLSEGAITYVPESGSDMQEQSIPLMPSHFKVTIQNQAIHFDSLVQFSQHNTLSAQASVPAQTEPLLKRSLSGKALLQVSDMRLLNHLLDPIDQLKGRIDASVDIKGQLSQPNVAGQITFDGAEVEVVDAAIKLTELQANVQASSDKPLRFFARAQSHKGKLTLEGTSETDFSNFSDLSQLQLNARIYGKDFRVLNKPDQKVDISPELSIQTHNQALHIKGSVRIPLAEISNINSGAPSIITASSDQIILDASGNPLSKHDNKQRFPLPIHANVRLEMGERVFLEAAGLNAELVGSIIINEKPGEATSASGEFGIKKGRFRKLGQDLVIRKGRVVFAGPITKPGLDLEAVRVINEGLVTGIRARGPLSKLEQFSLFSEPGGLTQADILSYITTGRALSGGSEGEISALTKASMALAMTGGKYLTDNIGSKLGVDDIGIDTAPGQDVSQAALTLGKYLSPRLYVSSGIGLFQPLTTLKLRYTINKKWRFISEASSAKSSGDFVYQFESGD